MAFLRPLVVEAVDGLFPIPTSFKGRIGAVLAEAANSGGFEPAAKRTLESLQLVAGRSMRLFRHGGSIGSSNGASGLTLVGASRPIPHDFAPAIITDASGRVRGTYAVWEASGGNLIRLPTKTNSYANVTFKLWIDKCGKDALADPEIGRLIFREVAIVIDANASKEWLVIGDKASSKLDIGAIINASVISTANVKYLNWGRHHGTNAYKDVAHMIVIGSHFYDAMAYKGLAIAALGVLINELTIQESPELAASEYQHIMLQAVMRGNARNASSGTAGECIVYVLASPKLNSRQLLLETFPGCMIEEWLPRQIALKGQAKQVVDYLTKSLLGGSTRKISKKAVREALGIKTKQRFGSIVNATLVRQTLNMRGIKIDNNHFFITG